MTRLYSGILRISTRILPQYSTSLSETVNRPRFYSSTSTMVSADVRNDAEPTRAFTLLKTSSEESQPRLGELKFEGRNTIQTPNFLGVASRGVIPHISPDAIPSQGTFSGVFTAIEDYIEKAVKGGTPPILNCKAAPDSTSLHTFTCLPAFLPTVLAPRRTPAVHAPKGNPDSGLAVFTSVGFQPVSPAAYANYSNQLSPDIVVALGDISYGPLPGRKRAGKMAERTSMWVDSVIDRLDKTPDGSGSERTKAAVFAPVMPTEVYGQSHYLMHIEEELAPKLTGLALYDSDLLPELRRFPGTEKLARLSLDEASGPHEILKQVQGGMDIFCLPFINTATEAGLALQFQFPATEEADFIEGRDIGLLAIDLSESQYATAVEPLSPGCSCYACTSHHRAYIAHLLSAHEMLAWTLLQVHNHAVINAFFEGVRKSIAAGTFAEDKIEFEKTYAVDIEDGKAQKPRLRGYHAKSTGGDAKRKPPAWGALGNEGVPKDEQSVAVPAVIAEEVDNKGFTETLAAKSL